MNTESKYLLLEVASPRESVSYVKIADIFDISPLLEYLVRKRRETPKPSDKGRTMLVKEREEKEKREKEKREKEKLMLNYDKWEEERKKIVTPGPPVGFPSGPPIGYGTIPPRGVVYPPGPPIGFPSGPPRPPVGFPTTYGNMLGIPPKAYRS